MFSEEQAGTSASSDDDIGELARQYLLQPDVEGLRQVECNIDRALTDGAWDDLSKWHRVRLRLQRFRQERETARRLARESRG